jgi:hypothetical protein
MSDARWSRARVSAKAIFWLTTGVAMVVFLGMKGVETFRIMRGGSQALAQVIAAYNEEREFDDGRRVRIVTVAEYEFFAAGGRFTGRTEGPRGFLSEGHKLTVEFNPQNPNQNRASGDRRALGDFFVLILFGGMFAYFAIRLNVETLVKLQRAAGAAKP